jgi:CRISPR-associated protein Cmr1
MLPARIFVGPAQSSAIEAWKKSLEAYREFRQSPRGKVHQKTIQTRNGPKTIRVPGRSHWPEADSIRKITGCSLKPPKGTPPSGVPADEDTHDHSTPVVPDALLPAFPKAILGLPINFHFADGPNKGAAAANLDPKDVQLYPLLPTGNGRMEKAERMASPIITRPLWMNGQWHPAIIILDQRLPETMQVRLEGRNASLTGNLVHDLPLSCAVDASLGAITPMRKKASAIEALIDFLGTQGFTEVSRS